jgi:hypothetical protein
MLFNIKISKRNRVKHKSTRHLQSIGIQIVKSSSKKSKVTIIGVDLSLHQNENFH